MHLCDNLDSRTPSVTTLEKWTLLQTFLRRKIYDRELNSVQIWLPLSDRETEGVWKESDEKSCKILVLKEGYNMRVPPLRSDLGPVDVAVSIDLLKRVDIDEEDYSLEIQFEIVMSWKEKRATYHNLKGCSSPLLFSEWFTRMWAQKLALFL